MYLVLVHCLLSIMQQTEGYGHPYPQQYKTYMHMYKQGSAPGGHLKASLDINNGVNITHTPRVHSIIT